MTVEKDRKKRRWPWIIVAVAVLGVGLAAVTVMGATRTMRAATAQVQAQSGQVVTATIGDLAASATASGSITAPREARLSLAINGVVADVPVSVGDDVQAGDVLVQLETTDLDRALANAVLNLTIQEANLRDLLNGTGEAELASAQATVASAQAQLDKVRAGADPNDVTAARASLAAAQAAYADVVAGPDGDTLAQAEASLKNAEASLRQAQAAYDQVAGRPDVGMTQQALNLEQATNNYNSAQAAYDQAVAGASQDQIEQARSSVEQARANLQKLLDSPTAAELASADSQLAQAQAQLASVTEGASSEQTEVAQAQVEQARLKVEEARENLGKASLRAPFAGVITAVHIAQGEQASGLAVEMADTASLEVVLNVDEVDVGELAVGQPAVVTLETWPGEQLQGTLASIAPKATAGSSGIASYEVRVALGASSLPVRIGMTADADLIIAEQTGVLLVPSQAITADREAGTYYVNLVGEDPEGNRTFSKTAVTIGLKDGDYTEITGGLNAGDQVLIGDIITAAAPERPGFLPPTGGGVNGGGPFGG
jgi:RND family efflux transporter MFP subunit